MSQRAIYCKYCQANNIKTEITFSDSIKSETGKSIPLDKFTKQPHECPYSPYAKKQDQKQNQNQTSSNNNNNNTLTDAVLKIIIEKQDKIISLIEQLGNALNRVGSLMMNSSGSGDDAGLVARLQNKISVLHDEISELKTDKVQLQEVIKSRPDNFQKANELNEEGDDE